MVKISKNSYIDNKNAISYNTQSVAVSSSIMTEANLNTEIASDNQAVELNNTKDVKRTEAELNNALLEICKKYNVDIDSLRNDYEKLLKSIKQNCTTKHIKVDEIPQETFTKIVNYVEELVKEAGNDVTLEKLMKLHDSKILDKQIKLVNSNEDEYTFANIEKAGLVAEIAKISNIPLKELATYDAQQLKPYVEQLRAAYSELKDKEGVTAAEITDLAHNYVMLERVGVSKEQYKEMVKSGEAKGIRELLGLAENEEISPEKIAEIFERQNEKYKKMAECLSQEEKDILILNQRKKMRILLASTSPKDRIAFIHTIKHLFADNRYEFLDDLIASLDEKDKIETANSLDNEKLKDMLLNFDAFGKNAVEHTTEIVAEVKSYQSAEVIAKSHNELVNNPEFKAIMDKVNSGEELTKEEQELYKYYTGHQAGEIAGTANHSFLALEEIEPLVTQMTDDAYSLPNYREVLAEVNNYIENSENLVMPKEAITELLDKATRGNYSTVVSDIENGTITELNPPLSAKADAASSTGVGYNNNKTASDVAAVIARVEASKAQFKTEEPKEEYTAEKKFVSKNASADTYIREFGVKEGMKQLFANNSFTDAMDEVFNSTSTIAQLYGKRVFTTYKAYQERILTNVSHNAFSTLWNIAADSVKANFDASTRNNSADSKKIKEDQEEIKEKREAIA